MTDPHPARAEILGLLARAPSARLAALFPQLPAHQALRAPETGTVMVRARQGGTGAPFNLGEITVTRASVRVGEAPDAVVGHAWVQGRDREHARRAAVLDALMQTPEAPSLDAAILAPLRAEEAARRTARARKAAATKVEFFTLVRGEVE